MRSPTPNAPWIVSAAASSSSAQIAGGEFGPEPAEQGQADRGQRDQDRQLDREDQARRRGDRGAGLDRAADGERAGDDRGEQAVEALPHLADRGADLAGHAVDAGRAFAEEQRRPDRGRAG